MMNSDIDSLKFGLVVSYSQLKVYTWSADNVFDGLYNVGPKRVFQV